ncbi:MAG: methyltransferase domain-containing protein [Microbacteriaceae bacterium]|nr:methyltransferase domain-containing protein [Microbacteriaceae bacterium]
MTPSEAFWHDLEHAGYVADLPIWLEVCASAAGDTVELGCGTGRVANYLGANGVSVVGVDRDQSVLAALLARRVPGSSVDVSCSDILNSSRQPMASAVIAPAMFFQTIGSQANRVRLLAQMCKNLKAGGLLAISVVEGLKPFSAEEIKRLPVDRVAFNGTTYESRVVALRESNTQFDLVRERRSDGEPIGTRIETLSPWSIAEAVEEAASTGFELGTTWTLSGTGRHGAMTILVFHAT